MIRLADPHGGPMTVNFAIDEGPSVHIPDRATRSLASFREWAGDNDLPEKTRVDFYKGEVWVDMSREQVFTHGLLKTRIAAAIDALVQAEDLGYYWCNGVLVTNEDAALSGNPDGTFVSHDTLDAGRVTLTEGADEGYVELVGTPDMVLEIVSPGSVTKDTVTLRQAYWEAGIPEYWLVDARGDTGVDFRILKRGAKGYAETRKQAGWQKSGVLGKSFRLTRGTDRRGNPTFTLEVK
jgi:Uma2 family endonuclease